LFYLVLVCRGNEKVINVNTNHAIGFVEHAVIGLCHGETMSRQDAVDALASNPRRPFEAIQGAVEPAHTPWFFEAFGQFHVDR
jgi:hypothetical protein